MSFNSNSSQFVVTSNLVVNTTSTFNDNVTINAPIVANGQPGAPGQLLVAGAEGNVYWNYIAGVTPLAVQSTNATSNVATFDGVGALQFDNNNLAVTQASNGVVKITAFGGQPLSYFVGLSALAYSNAVNYANQKAAEAFANASNLPGTAYANAVLFANTKGNQAYSNAVSYADQQAAAAYSNAVTVAAIDATTKAAAAYSNSVSFTNTKTNESYANGVAYANIIAATAFSNAISTAATDASTKAATAYSNAISAAALDATTKANQAYSNAVSVAASDASTKANQAYSNAVSVAASDASTKAATSYTNAVSVAASDASTKAATAYSNAIAYANSIAATAYSNAIAYAASNTYVNNTFATKANPTLSGDVTITGNLTVSGTTTYINTTDLNIGDNRIVLNADVGNVAPTENAGLVINRGSSSNVELMWDETNDRWAVNNTYVNGQLVVTGGLIVGGGVGGGNTLTISSITANGTTGNVGQVLTSGGTGNIYWGSVVATIPISETPPSPSIEGGMWWDSTSGTLKVYYNDGTSSQWVETLPGDSGGPTIAVNDTTTNSLYIALSGVSNGVWSEALLDTSLRFVPSTNTLSVNTIDVGRILANTSSGTAGQVLTSNGSGLYWSTITFTDNSPTAYSNAIAYSSNANNLTSGTVSPARLPQANTTANGAVILLDSISNTSIAVYAATANSVKTAYDTAISANTRAASAQTAATSAYSNAISVASTDASTKAATAYSNAVSVAAADASTKAATAFSNAVAYAASNTYVNSTFAPITNPQVSSLGVGTAASGITGEIRATNEITAYFASDERLKENIHLIQDALGKIKQLTGVMYDWTDDYITSRGGEDGYFVRKHDTGLIAQQVENVMPEVVATREDGYKAIRYERLMGLVIQAINELSEKVESIERKVD